MIVSDIYMMCDNIKPGATFHLYRKSSNYVNKEMPWKVGTYYDLGEGDYLLCDVSSFLIEDNGHTVHVRIL